MKEEAKKARDIRERTFEYALRAIKLYQYLIKRREGAASLIGRQFFKSATSIGANLEEAMSGESRADFIHKNGIAQKEARESLYWLKLLAASELVPQARLEPLLQETKEILAIITAIITKAKKSSDK